MSTLNKILGFIIPKEEEITRKQAEKVYYRNEITKEDIFNSFKRKVRDVIKQKSSISTCGIIEIDKPEVLERKDELIRLYRDELGYDVVIIDESILGPNWEESYMLLSWKRNDEGQ